VDVNFVLQHVFVALSIGKARSHIGYHLLRARPAWPSPRQSFRLMRLLLPALVLHLLILLPAPPAHHVVHQVLVRERLVLLLLAPHRYLQVR
jgi:hypothetical protein